MPKLLITDVRPEERPLITAFAKQHHFTPVMTPQPLAAVVDQPATADGLVIDYCAPLTAAIYQTLARNGIRQIATRSTGYDMFDLELARANHIQLTNVPAYSPRSVAEFALMQIFRLLRHTAVFDARVANNDYRWTPEIISREIHTVTVGIIGVGRIGGTLARLLHALGAKVIGFDAKPNPALANMVEFKTKEEVLKEADVISLHVDLNPTSTNLLTLADFKLMKPDAVLVNASRGAVINTKDLITALKTHEFAAAALDTVVGEENVFNRDFSATPYPETAGFIKQLHALPNVILTPHIAFYTTLAIENIVTTSLTDALAVLATGHSDHDLVTFAD